MLGLCGLTQNWLGLLKQHETSLKLKIWVPLGMLWPIFGHWKSSDNQAANHPLWRVKIRFSHVFPTNMTIYVCPFAFGQHLSQHVSAMCQDRHMRSREIPHPTLWALHYVSLAAEEQGPTSYDVMMQMSSLNHHIIFQPSLTCGSPSLVCRLWCFKGKQPFPKPSSI